MKSLQHLLNQRGDDFGRIEFGRIESKLRFIYIFEVNGHVTASMAQRQEPGLRITLSLNVILI